MIPEAQHLDSLFREKAVSLFILGALVGKAVTAAIELDPELRDGAVRIEEVDAAGVLASKLEFIEAPSAKQAPETLFGFSRFLAELPGEIPGSGSAGAVFAILWRGAGAPPPPPPPPPPGGGEFFSGVVFVFFLHILGGPPFPFAVL